MTHDPVAASYFALYVALHWQPLTVDTAGRVTAKDTARHKSAAHPPKNGWDGLTRPAMVAIESPFFLPIPTPPPVAKGRLESSSGRPFAASNNAAPGNCVGNSPEARGIAPA